MNHYAAISAEAIYDGKVGQVADAGAMRHEPARLGVVGVSVAVWLSKASAMCDGDSVSSDILRLSE